MMNVLFPRRCPLCGEVIAPPAVLCPPCAAQHEPKPMRLPLLTIGGRTIPCCALYPYSGAVRDALKRFKFGGQRGRAEGFGLLLGQQLRHQPEAFSAVTYVPMDKSKQLRRGYNQAQLLARFCAKAAGLPCCAWLHKTRATRTQHALDVAERAANAAGAYAAVVQPGACVALCDDIITTGATLRACTQALLEAGAAEVHCFCVAWTDGVL